LAGTLPADAGVQAENAVYGRPGRRSSAAQYVILTA
jgi:hypothetical protein